MADDARLRVVRGGPLARYAEAVLGGWLFLSPWVFGASLGHAWFGALIVIIAVLAIEIGRLRLLIAAAGIFLLFAPLVLRIQGPRVVWNDFVVGLALLSSSSLPTFLRRRQPAD